MTVGDVIYLVPSELWPFLNDTGPYIIFYIEHGSLYFILDSDGYVIIVVEQMVDKRRKKGWQKS